MSEVPLYARGEDSDAGLGSQVKVLKPFKLLQRGGERVGGGGRFCAERVAVRIESVNSL